MTLPLTQDLVRLVQAISYDVVPKDVLEKTKYCVLDYLADAVAGKAAGLPSVELAYRLAAENGGLPESTVIGSDLRAPAAEAAFVNSISGEVLELGDGENSVIGHPGQAVVPAALAIAERLVNTEGREKVSGPDFLEAVLAGYEAFLFVGETIMPEAYDRGFSASGSLGKFGAGAAAGRLYGFNDEKMKDVIALSACAAGFLRSWNLTGTMDKDLMVGDSTRRGVLAGILAQLGYTGSDAILEGEVGFCQAMRGEARPVRRRPGEYRIRQVYFKPYPCCRATHGAIDAALALYREGLRAEDVESLMIQSDTRGSLVAIPEPSSFVAIRFSQQYAAAAALIAGQATIREYTEDFAARPDVRRLLKKIRVETDPSLDEGWPERDYSRRITATLKDGSQKSAYVHDIKGSVPNPMTMDEVEAKCRSLFATLYDAERTEKIIRLCLRLDELTDLRELTSLLGR